MRSLPYVLVEYRQQLLQSRNRQSDAKTSYCCSLWFVLVSSEPEIFIYFLSCVGFFIFVKKSHFNKKENGKRNEVAFISNNFFLI